MQWDKRSKTRGILNHTPERQRKNDIITELKINDNNGKLHVMANLLPDPARGFSLMADLVLHYG